MGHKVIFGIPILNKIVDAVKATPKTVLVAAAVLPGGFIALGTYIYIKVKKK